MHKFSSFKFQLSFRQKQVQATFYPTWIQPWTHPKTPDPFPLSPSVLERESAEFDVSVDICIISPPKIHNEEDESWYEQQSNYIQPMAESSVC